MQRWGAARHETVSTQAVRRITLVSWPIERIWEVSEPRSGHHLNDVE
jgi:hypothetical protein